MHVYLYAQPAKELKGKLVDEDGKLVPFASIKAQPQDITYYTTNDGVFSIPVVAAELTLVISHVGMETITRTFSGEALTKLQVISLKKLSLKLPEVEVNGVRRKTSASNSSIIFDRDAIEQTQALSVANVLSYLPGQTILKPVISVQGAVPLTLRSALPMNSEQALNNAFGISVQVDGSTVSNDANMQAMNPGRHGFFQNSITHPDRVIRDRSVKNGTLYKDYGAAGANDGLDLRQIPAENIENIEVISGVASARYGDYTTGVVIINRQAGITPWRVNFRTNEGTQNIGINKGFKLSPSLGALNISFDYLNSNDEPRNKLKAFQRVSAGVLWTYQQKKAVHFKNTLSLDVNTTLDQTRLDPDEGTQRMAKFNNRNFRVSNRSEWLIRKPWLHNIQMQASYSWGRQESYDQYYLNSSAVKGIATGMETGTYEGYFIPGYYLAFKHIVGEPVSASVRLEASNIFTWGKVSNRLSVGANYSYNANKGPGMLLDPNRPRLPNSGNKNDRPRSFDETPVIQNAGFYVEDQLTARILDRTFNMNVGARGDIQNSFFTISPRLNASWKLHKNISWNVAYGIATKAPALSQISPGNVYIDVPLVNVYNGFAAESVYLVHTEVITINQNKDLKPYRSSTFETGLNLNTSLFNVSAFYFNRSSKDGFATVTQLLPLILPNYIATPRTGQKPLYEPDGTYKTYNVTYSRVSNGTYNRTNGIELLLSTRKIRSLQTSFSLSTSWYRSYYQNAYDEVSLPDEEKDIDYTKQAVYGIYSDMAGRSTAVKSTIVSTTHVPALRMAVMFTGELFWINRTDNLPSAVYPSGYLDKDGKYFPLTLQQAQSPEYAHLLKDPEALTTLFLPAKVYPNIHLRLSKEVGEFLRFSFNAYNVFNIRPSEKTATGANYYNGQPSFGAEMILTIK